MAQDRDNKQSGNKGISETDRRGGEAPSTHQDKELHQQKGQKSGAPHQEEEFGQKGGEPGRESIEKGKQGQHTQK